MLLEAEKKSVFGASGDERVVASAPVTESWASSGDIVALDAEKARVCVELLADARCPSPQGI